jgi:ABC-type antimicrobial peptide transport system permease subunit
MIMGLVLSNPILKVLLNNSSTSAATSASGPGGAGGGFMRMASKMIPGVQSLKAVIGPEIIIYGILAAIVIAILGSVIPSFIISRVRPAEVLRSE